MNGTNQNQSLGKSQLRHYFIRLTIWSCSKTCAFYGYSQQSSQYTKSDITSNPEMRQSVHRSCPFTLGVVILWSSHILEQQVQQLPQATTSKLHHRYFCSCSFRFFKTTERLYYMTWPQSGQSSVLFNGFMCFLCIPSSYLSMFGSDKAKAVIKVVVLSFNSKKEFCVYIM